jgi:hypothetical protein
VSPLSPDERARRRKLEQTRRRRARRIAGLTIGVCLVAAAGSVVAFRSEDGSPRPPAADQSLPARVEVFPAPAPQQRPAPQADVTRPLANEVRPIVWVQAGHAPPREPGYRDQTGAGSGPFGSEIGFTARVAPRLVHDLRRAGVDARLTPGKVTPLAARGAAFVSIHHDAPGGSALVGHAIAGAGENYYRGEGSGEPSPVPYPDSAPHRKATSVTPGVERQSRRLALSIARRYAAIFTAGNGAGQPFAGVQTAGGNPRVMRYYGFYRTAAEARIIVEAGATGTDDELLARPNLIAAALTKGVVEHLRARRLLP